MSGGGVVVVGGGREGSRGERRVVSEQINAVTPAAGAGSGGGGWRSRPAAAAAHIAHQADRIIISFTGVNDQRQIRLQPRRDVRCKNFLLLGSWGIVVVIIKSRFANADNFGVFCVGNNFICRDVKLRRFFRMMRVRADRAMDQRRNLRCFENSGELDHARADGQKMPDTHSLRAVDDFRHPFGGEIVVIEMAMAVY